MKKLIFFILFSSFICSIVLAQNMMFTFVPKDASNVIDSICAINLVTGEAVCVNETNQISLTITSADEKLISEDINIFPNPNFGEAELNFYSKQDDKIKVNLINSAGQIVASETKKINQGLQRFRILTQNKGIYLVQASGNRIKFTQKIICAESNGTLENIQHVGYSEEKNQEKSVVESEPVVIHFYIYSGDKVTKIANNVIASKTYDVDFYECKDVDGNTYPIVQIGEQWWMAENLTYLPKISPLTWSASEQYYYVYDYNGTDVSAAKATDNYKTYGVLYNWPAALEACPSGWHLPSDDEWKQLEMAIGMSQSEADDEGPRGTNEGTKLKASSMWNSNGKGTDDYGFSGLPGGYFTFNLTFDYLGNLGSWWSSTEGGSLVWGRDLYYEGAIVSRGKILKIYGFSVRCVRD